MSLELPIPIAAYVAANARLDVDGMVRPFMPGAVLRDNGTVLQGHAEIRHLFEKEVVPVKAIFTPDTVRHEGGQVVVEGPATAPFRAAPFASPTASRSRTTPSSPWRSRYDHQG